MEKGNYTSILSPSPLYLLLRGLFRTQLAILSVTPGPHLIEEEAEKQKEHALDQGL